MSRLRVSLPFLVVIVVATWLHPGMVPASSAAPTVTFSGSGIQTTSTFLLDEGLVVATATHSGSQSFIVDLVRVGEGSKALVNDTGAVSVKTADRVEATTQYQLSIRADGAWTVTLEQPRPTTAPGLPHSYSGRGDSVTTFVALSAGTITARTTHNGAGEFSLRVIGTDGRIAQFVFIATGPFNGSKSFGLSTGGIYLIDVEANGDWTVDIEQPSTASPATPTVTATPPTGAPITTPTPTRTPGGGSPVSCTPRPPVTVTVVRFGPGQLLATIRVSTNTDGGANGLSALSFGQIRGGTVQVNGGPVVQSGQRLSVPGSPATIALLTTRSGGSPDLFVPLTVTDACGEWPTFFGSGSAGPDLQ
jgi:hypothetical protein